jgi:peptide/nickel transport system ATP-binding protein
MSDQVLLEIKNLRVRFATPKGNIDAVRGISFQLGRERLGIVGESGSGKSVTAKAILGLVRAPGQVQADRLSFDGIELLQQNERTLRDMRGKRISMVMQDPKFSLNPVMKVGKQIEEAIRVHDRASGRVAQEKSVDMLRAVRIREPEHVYHSYPHEVSGGMGQRIMLAMMLVANPYLLIADEPTSALDVTVQTQVLAILDDLVSERGMGLILISHDLNLVASFCDRVLVMYAGRIVESVKASELQQARHPYTIGLLESQPSIDQPRATLPTLQPDPAWLTS